MFHQTFPQEISFLLKIKVHNLPQSKNFCNSQKFPRIMSACPRLFPYLQDPPLNRVKSLWRSPLDDYFTTSSVLLNLKIQLYFHSYFTPLYSFLIFSYTSFCPLSQGKPWEYFSFLREFRQGMKPYKNICQMIFRMYEIVNHDAYL